VTLYSNGTPFSMPRTIGSEEPRPTIRRLGQHAWRRYCTHPTGSTAAGREETFRMDEAKAFQALVLAVAVTASASSAGAADPGAASGARVAGSTSPAAPGPVNAVPARAHEDPPIPAPGIAWRAARWGMSPEEVVAAFPGEATLLAPPLNLPDGSVVAVGIDALPWEDLTVNVRFVFEGGRLALVSLRTPPTRYADAAAYDRVCRSLTARWGDPLESASDKQFIDLRQTRWDRGGTRSDIKYIPGVIALVHYPRPGAAPEAAPAPPAGAPSPAAPGAGAAAP